MSYNSATGGFPDSHEIRPNGYDDVCCSNSKGSAELKVYQAFIFSVPIFFAFILLFLFYYFYLRRHSADWSSLRMRASIQTGADEISRCELGLKKELREMLPIIVYKESFSVKDTQCSVCLGDYQAEDRLQQIPRCGHTFHMDCIDHWLTTHSTCPLCRRSLLTPSRPSRETEHNNRGQTETEDGASSRPNQTSSEQGAQDERVNEVHGQIHTGERSDRSENVEGK